MHQPKGQTLRFIIAMLKVNNDLERISDLAVNMAKSVKTLSEYKEENLFFLHEMITKVLAMLEGSIQALLDLDTKQAIRICALDEEVDTLKHKQRKEILEIINKKPTITEYLLDIIINGRRLEKDVQWSEEGIIASFKFIQKLWSLNEKVLEEIEKNHLKDNSSELTKFTNKFIKKISYNLENFHYNIIIANLHEMHSYLSKEIVKGYQKKTIVNNLFCDILNAYIKQDYSKIVT